MEAKKARKKNFANFITNLHDDDNADVETLESSDHVLTLKSELEDTVPELSPLSDQEQDTRQQLETIIQDGLDTYLAVGTALWQIRKDKLYRSTHLSLKAYLAERFDVGRQRAYQLMEAAQVVNALMAEVQTADDNVGVTIVMPKKESHASALADVPEEYRMEVWEAVVKDEERTGKAITAKKIGEKAEAITGVIRNKKPPKDIPPRKQQESDEIDELKTVDITGGDPNNNLVNSYTSIGEGASGAEDRLERLQKAFLNAQPVDLVLKISARLLRDEQVAEDWQALRQDSQIIEKNGIASLTLQEAFELGILKDYVAKWS